MWNIEVIEGSIQKAQGNIKLMHFLLVYIGTACLFFFCL